MNEPLQSQALTEEEKEARAAWQAHLRELAWKTPERLEDAAKFLATMVSVSLTLFLGIQDLKNFQSTAARPWLLQLAFVAVLASLLLAFLVVFNFRTRYRSTYTVAGFERWHRRMVRRKLILLVSSMLCFVLALTLIVSQVVF